MRIIAGQFKGRRLWSPARSLVRPTSERVREAVFDVLGQHVIASRVLDLFAGTGAFGFEALSRGAAYVSFVERNSASVQIIKRNAEELGVRDRVSVRVGGAAQALNFFVGAKETFDVIFMDPPYDAKELDLVWRQPALSRVMSQNGVLVVESRRTSSERQTPDLLSRTFARRYGDTLVEMFRLGEEE